MHAGILKPWRGHLPWLPAVFSFYHVFSPPLSGLNRRSLFPLWESGPPFPKMAPPFTGSAHTPLPGSGTIISITSQTNINKILTVQKKAIRIITNSTYNAHTNPLFQQLGILSFPSIIKFRKLLFMHSVYNNYCNETLSNVWTKNEHRRTEHNLRNFNNFLLPQPCIELFRKFPAYSFASTWNSLGDLKLQANPITFKISLEDELLNQLDEM